MVSKDLLQRPAVHRSQVVADLSDVCWFPARLHPSLKETDSGAALQNVYVISSPRNIFVNNEVSKFDINRVLPFISRSLIIYQLFLLIHIHIIFCCLGNKRLSCGGDEVRFPLPVPLLQMYISSSPARGAGLFGNVSRIYLTHRTFILDECHDQCGGECVIHE